MERSAKLQGQGAKDTLAGKAQRAWGKLTGSKHHQIEGNYKVAKGTLKTKTGQALEALKDIDDKDE